MAFQVAHLLIELARFLMGLVDWIEEKWGRDKGNGPMSYEVFKVHCFGCDQPTGAYVGGPEGELLPPVYCGNCIEDQSEEESEAPEHETPDDFQTETGLS